ncbi:hypothetical protein ACIRON_12505 [Nocardioides sp. NPDC101246]|uniref:hypothetical protein n=1 Tax=Nocardioides sp. NPDC101246 TaxID=3364336 RepID=UPI0038099DB6
MSVPVAVFRTASFLLTMALVGLAYPLLAALAYVGFLIASAVGDLGLGGPLAGPVLVLLGAAVGAICVAVGAPAALAGRLVGGVRGVLVGAAVLVVLGGGATWVAWLVFDLAGRPWVPAATLVAASTPAALVLALSDAVADLVTRLPARGRASAAHA